MGVNAPRYTKQQREAAAMAMVDRGMPARAIAEAAQAGQLDHYGQKLPAFEINPRSIPKYASSLRKERAGNVADAIAEKPHRDAIEELRRAMMTGAKQTQDAWLKQKPDERDVERGRQIARLLREISALPAREEPAPPKPGAKVDGHQHGGQTRGGIAGTILKDHRATTPGTEPAPSPSGRHDAHRDQRPESAPPPDAQGHHDARATGTANPTHEPTEPTQNHPTPGSAARALAASLPAG